MGRRYNPINYFNPNDSNTIDDISGFKKKSSEMLKRWDGIFTVPATWEVRHPQDFPPKIIKQVVYKNVRVELVEAEGAVTPPPVI